MKQKVSKAEKGKRIAAILGVIILLSLYLFSFIFAILAKPYAHGWFLASLYCTIVVPVLMYVFFMFYRLMNKEKKSELQTKKESKVDQ